MLWPVLLPKRSNDSSKHDYGGVLVIGGSIGLTGAVCLAAKAALHIGTGLVRVGVPQDLNNIIEVKLTEEMSIPLAQKPKGYLGVEAFKQIVSILDTVDVLAIGPGASRNKSTGLLIRKLVKEVNKPLVIDADGLNALVDNLDILAKRKNRNVILTPHYGEFSRLIKKDISTIKKARKELALEFALRYNLILVLKGYKTLVSDGSEIFENTTGNPGMATAGSGDVLTGIIAGLIAQGLSLRQAGQLGVYLHGLAGDLAAKDKTQFCLVASDIIDYLPEAIKKSKVGE